MVQQVRRNMQDKKTIMSSKGNVKMVTCTGEAHSNPFINHCTTCLPYWGRYPVCNQCGHKLYPTPTGYSCHTCKVFYKGKL